jgi:hypothetical protein
MTRYTIDHPSGVRMHAAGELDGVVIGDSGYCPLIVDGENVAVLDPRAIIRDRGQPTGRVPAVDGRPRPSRAVGGRLAERPPGVGGNVVSPSPIVAAGSSGWATRRGRPAAAAPTAVRLLATGGARRASVRARDAPSGGEW